MIKRLIEWIRRPDDSPVMRCKKEWAALGRRMNDADELIRLRSIMAAIDILREDEASVAIEGETRDMNGDPFVGISVVAEWNDWGSSEIRTYYHGGTLTEALAKALQARMQARKATRYEHSRARMRDGQLQRPKDA